MIEALVSSEEPSEVDRYQDIQVRDVIPWCGRVREPQDLSFLESTISVTSTGSGRDKSYFARFNHPIFQPELYSLLESVAPIKGQGARGVYDDWNIFQSFDRDEIARVERHANSEKIGEAWIKFVKNYNGLFHALTTQSPQFLEEQLSQMHGEPYDKARDRYIEEGDLRSAIDDLDLGGEQADRNFYAATLEELNGIAKNVGLDSGLNFATAMTGYWKTEKHEKLLRTFFKSHPDYINPQLLSENYGCNSSFTANLDGERYVFYVPWGSQVDSVYESRGNRFSISLNDRSSQKDTYEAEVVKNGEDFSMKIDDEWVNQNAIYPVLAWEKRKFNGFRSKRALLTDPSTMQDFGIKPNDNLLLGLIALGYLDIKATRGWPKRQSYGKKGDGQMMRAAQVPVLALQFQDQLERSNILANIEKNLN